MKTQAEKGGQVLQAEVSAKAWGMSTLITDSQY